MAVTLAVVSAVAGAIGAPSSDSGAREPLTSAAPSTWQNITPSGVSLDFNSPPSNYGTQTIALSPAAPRTVYVGTAYQGIWKSVDSGASWARVNTGRNGPNLTTGRNWTVAVDPTDANTLYTVAGFGVGQGLWKSTTGGVDWDQLLPVALTQATSADVYSVAIDPADRQHLLLGFHSGWAGGSDGGVLESRDGGASWVTHGPRPGWGAGNYALFITSSTWLLGTQGNGFWRTTDSGTTWTQVSTVAMQHGATQLYRAATGTLYVGALHTLLRSTDGGASWTAVGPNTPDGYNAVIGDGTTLYAQPANTGASSSGLHPYYVSAETDGTVWTAQNGQTFTDGPMSLAVDRQNGIVYSSNWDAGVWRLTTAPSPPPGPAPTPIATPTPAMATPAPSGNAAPGALQWKGSSFYLHGANVPWLNWGCDFGCGSGSGVSSAASTAAFAGTFAQARAAGLRTIRWWTFEGNGWQVKTDAGGTPIGLDPAIYVDFDAALALAAKFDLYVDFVLFNSPTAVPTAWSTDPVKRSALAAALSPLFARYGNDPHLLSWEIFNEPEWDIWTNKIDAASVQSTVKAVAAAVHANSGAYVTVGSATLEGLSLWVGQGLDYYQAHWYDYMSSGGWCAMCTDYPATRSKYGLDHPLVIGEMYAGTDTSGRFDSFYQRGYAGAWAWSLYPDHTSDHLGVDLAAATAFTAGHSAVGPHGITQNAPNATPALPTGAPAPPSTPAPTSTAGRPAAPTNPVAPTAARTAAPSNASITPSPTQTPKLPSSAPPVSHNAPVGPGAPLALPLAPPPILRPATPGAEAYHAGWLDQSAYPRMQAGESQQVTIRFRNTGSAPWVKGVIGEQANLGVFGDGTPYVYPNLDVFYSAMAGDAVAGMTVDSGATARVLSRGTTVWSLLYGDWPTPDRVAVQKEAVVPPGGLGTFTFTVRAPLTPGVYQLRLRPVVDGTVWMEDAGAFILVTSLANYRGAWVSQSGYPTLHVGETSAPISVVFRNTGDLVWTKGAVGEQVNLAFVGDQKSRAAFAVNWPAVDRVAIQTEARVPPGATATFTFQVRAPNKPGTYVLPLQPVVDGTMWLADQGVFVLITVVP